MWWLKIMPEVMCTECKTEFWVADGTDVGSEVYCPCGVTGTLQKKDDSSWVLEHQVEGSVTP